MESFNWKLHITNLIATVMQANKNTIIYISKFTCLQIRNNAKKGEKKPTKMIFLTLKTRFGFFFFNFHKSLLYQEAILLRSGLNLKFRSFALQSHTIMQVYDNTFIAITRYAHWSKIHTLQYGVWWLKQHDLLCKSLLIRRVYIIAEKI